MLLQTFWPLTFSKLNTWVFANSNPWMTIRFAAIGNIACTTRKSVNDVRVQGTGHFILEPDKIGNRCWLLKITDLTKGKLFTDTFFLNASKMKRYFPKLWGSYNKILFLCSWCDWIFDTNTYQFGKKCVLFQYFSYMNHF